MKVVKSGEGEPYEAKNHFNCWSIKKIVPGQTSQILNIVYSHFLPNGGAVMSSSTSERAYYLVSGLLAIKGQEDEYILKPGDMIYIAAGEDRAIRVLGNEPATMLVVMAQVNP